MSELSPLSKSIVREGRGALAPTDAERTRIRAGIAARLAATAVVAAPTAVAAATASSGGAAAGSSLSLAGALKVTLLVGAIGAGGGTAWVVLAPDPSTSTDATLATVQPPTPSGPSRIEHRSRPAIPPLSAAPAPEKAEPVRPPTARATRPAQEPPAHNPGLADELQLLEPARRALERGDAPAALSALERYEREHPGGQLAQEAELLRADALCQVGRGDEAQRLLQRVRDRRPDAPGIDAVAASCARFSDE